MHDRGSQDGEERRLVERAAGGDDSAVEELLVRNIPRLRAFVRLRCGPELRAKESASDLVQSMCRDVLQNMDGFRWEGAESFRAWLYTAAARKVADRAEFWRAQRRDPGREHGAGDEALLAVYRESATPSRVLAGREGVEHIERAFDDLSPDYREAVLLSRVLGLPRAEVARRMGKSEDSVRDLLFRGLAQLSKKLA